MDNTWNIIYYQAPQSSSSPIFDFIESLDLKTQTKISNALDLLMIYGIRLGLPHVKKLAGTDLWELRILGSDSIRIIYVAISGKSFLLLHGFQKKKQKTEKKEIKTAVARLKEYETR